MNKEKNPNLENPDIKDTLWSTSDLQEKQDFLKYQCFKI